jgi:hypothetical protein
MSSKKFAGIRLATLPILYKFGHSSKIKDGTIGGQLRVAAEFARVAAFVCV